MREFLAAVPVESWLAMLVVLLIGLRLKRNGRGKRPIHELLHEFYYWMGLNGDNGLPSNTKVKMFLTLIVTAIAVLLFGVRLIEAGQELNTPYVLLVLILGAESFGIAGYKMLVESKFGGLDTAMTTREQQAPARMMAQAEIIKARQTGDNFQPTGLVE